MTLGPLDRIPAWARHALVIFISTALGVVLPLVAANQDNVSVWLVHTLRLPTYVLPIVATIVGGLILRFTTLTRQYGTGANPPATPVIDPANGTPPATAGYSAVELLVVVILVLIAVFLIIHLR